jgi:hypothetical protein
MAMLPSPTGSSATFHRARANIASSENTGRLVSSEPGGRALDFHVHESAIAGPVLMKHFSSHSTS